jgi:leucine dehydrogenase
MTVFSSPAFDHHEQVTFFNVPEAGLRCIAAIHDTTRGPALGGARMWPYASDADALTDVLRLSRGMTFKSALAELPLGGGKAVILGDPKTDKSPALWQAYGRAVDRLGGRYITAEDVGVTVADLEAVRRETRHVAGIPEGGAGDPSPATAFGVFVGIRAAVRHALVKPDCSGLRVAVQGLGAVGFEVCRLLHEAGALLIVADLDGERVDRAVGRFGPPPRPPTGSMRRTSMSTPPAR